MSGSTLLEIFLILQIFIIGIVAALAWQHAREHFKPRSPEAQQPTLPTLDLTLPPDVEAHFRQASEQLFQEVLGRASTQLQRELSTTSEHINNMVSRLATEIISEELEHYRQDLAQLHQQAETDLGGMKGEMSKHEAALKAQVTQELAAEKQRLVQQIDTKLADAVGSFLSETLQHNVDLGSQTAYLVAMLEEHKADFVKEVRDDTETTG